MNKERLKCPVETDTYAVALRFDVRHGMAERWVRRQHGVTRCELADELSRDHETAGTTPAELHGNLEHLVFLATTERYLHANRTSYPDMAELAEARMFPSAS
jgi:hypothetical protein